MRARMQAFGVLSALAGAVACLGPAQWRYEEAIGASDAAAQHAVHEARLASLMRDLDALRSERLPRAFDVRTSEARQLREIARVARAMAASAAQIGLAAPLELDDGELREFRSLALELERLAASLADDVALLPPARRRARVAEIDSTCARCHDRFRIPDTSPDVN